MPGAEPVSLVTPGREFAYAAEDFRRIARLVHAEAGILLPESKEMLVYSRLVKRLRSLGMGDFRSYCKLVEGEGGQDERRKMISALTTNVTRFFREDHHFRHFAGEVLPGLAERARKGGRVRIWSAGCATGEEPYSIAFSLLKAFPEAARFDLKLLATDIDPEVIATARQGIYPAEALKSLPDWTRGWVVPLAGDPAHLQVAGTVRSMIDFRQLNLIHPLPMKGPFDVIFCRNVTIYFDAETQDRLWDAFARVMAPGSHLYIGHSERLSPRVARLFTSTGMTSYRLHEARP